MTVTYLNARKAPLDIARELASEFARTAVDRDAQGGTPKAERDRLRQSGLLALSIPAALGGLGASWSETFEVVREFARVDSSIGHVFGFHHLMLATVRLFARPEQSRTMADVVQAHRQSQLVLGQHPEPAGHPDRLKRTQRLARVFRAEKLLLRCQ